MEKYLKNYLSKHKNWIIDKDYPRLYNNLSISDRADLTAVLLEAKITFLPYMVDIPQGSFYGLKIIDNIIIPESIIYIGTTSFARSSVQSIELPASIKRIGRSAFANCYDLKSISIPEKITQIPKTCFYNCTDLEAVNLPDSIEDIGLEAFMGCKRLKSIKLPEDLAFIGTDAFYGCENLETIELPASIMSIKDGAFSNCIKLKKVIVHGTEDDLDDMLETNKYNTFYNSENIEFIYI